MKRWHFALILAALLPAAILAWRFRAMPQLGAYHDDSIYLSTAKSWAESGSYRVGSLPDAPYQTKYPPLYPAFLAILWKLTPEFPANLPWLLLLNWLFLPLSLYLLWQALRAGELPEGQATLAACWVALSPVAALFSTLLMTEFAFSALLFGVTMLAQRAASPRAALWAGVLAGFAFLCRSTALALLLSSPLVFLLEKRRREALYFVAGMLPLLGAWFAWSSLHRAPTDDLTLYYLNYFGFYLRDLQDIDFSLLLASNLFWAWRSLGELFLLQETVDFLPLSCGRILAVLALVGLLREFYAGRLRHAAAAALCYLGGLLLWNYPPDTRFQIPIFGILAAGLTAEGARIGQAFRQAWGSRRREDRIAARLLAAGGVALATWVLSAGLSRTLFQLPALYASEAAVIAAMQPQYRWLREATPPGTRVLAYRDAVAYLYTGRQAISTHIPQAMLRQQQTGKIETWFATLPASVQRHRLSYVIESPVDLQLHLPAIARAPYRRAIAAAGLPRIPGTEAAQR